jgi:hypothetical protein
VADVDDGPGCVDSESDDDELEGETGRRMTTRMPDPCKPSLNEIAEHDKTHLPYRNWCRHCVFGRGKEMPHRRSKEKPGMPEVHFDFFFVGRANEPGETLPILCARERSTRMTLASAVPSKSTGTFISRRIVSFLREIGCEHGSIVVKSDQEPAIMAIVTDVGRVRAATGSGKYVVEQSPVRSSQSNGVIERGIQSVEAQIRVLTSALEKRWKVELPSKHAVMPWIIEYAALLLNRFEVGRDGKTSYERCKGKSAKTLGF